MPSTYRVSSDEWIDRPLEEVFDFFSRAENLQQLTPPWLNFRFLQLPDKMQAGALIQYALNVRGIPIRWTTQITEWNPPHSFVDIQLKGPYALWKHEHTFAAEREGTRIKDKVTYALPFGFLGALVHWAFVKKDLHTMFAYRRQRVEEIFSKRTFEK
jgi:hypothetical protein